MKKIVCTVSAAVLMIGLLSGCGDGRDSRTDENMGAATGSPVASASPMIVTPDPENGMIEDGDGMENGTGTRPSNSPAGTVSPSPATGKMG